MKAIRKINSIDPSLPDHLFITCASFEERCLGSVNNFDGYSAEKLLMYHFKEPCPNREEIATVLKLELSKYGNTNTVKCEHGKAEEYTEPIVSVLKGCKRQFDKLRVTLDITTFPKLYLLEILRLLGECNKPVELQLLYTKPKHYASPDEGALSFGIDNINVPPGYWGDVDPGKEDVLVVLLGFEEERVKAVIEEFQPHKIVYLLAGRGTSSQWDSYSKMYNADLLQQADSKTVIPVSPMQPLKVMKSLEKLWQSETFSGNNLNYFILPLGPKPQVIGTYLFLRRYPKASIIYGQALRHNEPYYSRGIGKISQETILLPKI